VTRTLATACLSLWLLSGCVSEPWAQAVWIFETPPGATAFEAPLRASLASAWTRREADYVPRTQHLRDDGAPSYINRLFLESSPYLRQHAHNPLNWYPWGDEAFELARALGRPVLLSIGYSTCHWCHVMEEESFDDEEIARYLNENYIVIKVDREVRPDLDAIYMSAVQLFLQGGGGWPMTVWLTPDGEPFSGATYLPARDGDRGATIGFLTIAQRLRAAYDEQPDQIAAVSAEVTARIRDLLAPGDGRDGLPTAQSLHATAAYYRAGFDETHGSLEGQRKFPSSLSVRMLLRHHRRTGDLESLAMATRTLEAMAAGGIHDQVGGGFHRYSTDPAWLVPHFEKMLYDNALLVPAYLEAYQVTGREDFAEVARDILRYVARDMTAPEGAFYSATDADSQGPDGEREEGLFFTWTPDEIAAVLDAEQARAAVAYFGITDAGNFEGRTILHTPRSVREVAAEIGLSEASLRRMVGAAREQLYAARATRSAPLRDDKILTAWNGLMISALAQASLVLDEPVYAERAARAADYLLRTLRRGDGLLRAALGGAARQTAYLDDYAFLVAGLLDLYEADGDLRWLEEASALDAVLERDYEDTSGGGFFRTAANQVSLLTREKPTYDGAEPSGNSVAVHNLLRLHELTTDDRYRVRAERAFQAFGAVLADRPSAVSEMLLAVDYQLDTPKEIVLVVSDGRDDAAPFLAELRARFLPNRILTIVAEGEELERHARVVPLLDGKTARDGRATAYVCENRICDLPTTDPSVFATQIATVHPLAPPE
jgi:uncharacterized protein YyaL (SSP411 family)